MALSTALILVLCMGLVTLACRAIPFVVLGHHTVPQPARRWLAYVPTSVLCAMLLPQILAHSGNIQISSANHLLLATLPALAVGIRYKNICVTVIVGMLSLALIRLL